MPAPSANRSLWTCPLCGQRFVTKNMSHSCGRVPLDTHFRGKDPVVRDLFDALVAETKSIGNVHCVRACLTSLSDRHVA